MIKTNQIIKEIVHQEIQVELIPVNAKLDEISKVLNVLSKDVTNIKNTVTDLAGDIRRFDQEQTVMSSHVLSNTDRIENLETKVFGQIQIA
jgi:hypothetical protein